MTIDIRLIIALCWGVFLAYWLVTAVGTKKDIRVRPWWHVFLLRFVALAIIVALFHLAARNGLVINLEPPAINLLVQYLGLALTVAGIGLAIWARVHLGRNWSARPALKEEHELITSGPYKRIRHPIYTGVLLAILGSALAIDLWLILGLLIFLAIFVRRVGIEENLMMQQFPSQYPDYKKHTQALLPFIW